MRKVEIVRNYNYRLSYEIFETVIIIVDLRLYFKSGFIYDFITFEYN